VIIIIEFDSKSFLNKKVKIPKMAKARCIKPTAITKNELSESRTARLLKPLNKNEWDIKLKDPMPITLNIIMYSIALAILFET